MAGDREGPLSKHPYDRVGILPVEDAVSQRDALDALGMEGLLFGRDHRVDMGVEPAPVGPAEW
ncbi:hypothetical protein QFZ29_002754 [Agromyces albus]|nr:hypothetical protein [Agromyces albus]MDQ0576531.1 hypothetical protein [Agromyces albus]